MIGRWTAISAAHCFWDRFANVPVVSAAAAVGVASSGSRYPNGPWTITSQTRFKPTQLWGCYDVYFPVLWQTANSWDFDMGIIGSVAAFQAKTGIGFRSVGATTTIRCTRISKSTWKRMTASSTKLT